MYNEKDFVRLKCSGNKLAKVLKVNEKTLLVKIYNREANKFHPYLETVAISMIEPAELTEEERLNMPCGKVVLSKNTALMLLATNEQFKSDKRREKRVYYCTKCAGYHTTSQPWMPLLVRQHMNEHPLLPQDVTIKGDIICERSVFRWLRDTLGLQISHKWFKSSLKEFGETIRGALEKILSTPDSYIEFFFEKRFVKKHSLEIN
jgi:hypothetical protein